MNTASRFYPIALSLTGFLAIVSPGCNPAVSAPEAAAVAAPLNLPQAWEGRFTPLHVAAMQGDTAEALV